MAPATLAIREVSSKFGRVHRLRLACGRPVLCGFRSCAKSDPHIRHPATVEQRKDVAASEPDSTLNPYAKAKEGDMMTQSRTFKSPDASASLDTHVTTEVPFANVDFATALITATAMSVSIPIEGADSGKPKEVPEISRTGAVRSSVASATKEENDRTFFDLDLIKEKMGETFGDIRIALTKSDTKHDRFTL